MSYTAVFFFHIFTTRGRMGAFEMRLRNETAAEPIHFYSTKSACTPAAALLQHSSGLPEPSAGIRKTPISAGWRSTT